MKTNKFYGVLSLDVDAQNTFTPRCPEELPVPGGDEIVEELNKQAEIAQYRAGSKDCHSPASFWRATPQLPQLSEVEGYQDLDVRWNIHAVQGTAGFELIDGLPHPRDYDFFVYKGQEPDMHPYGVCYQDLDCSKSTGLLEWISYHKVHTVIVGGLAADYCVAETINQLLNFGLKVIVNKEACRGLWYNVEPANFYGELNTRKNCTVVRDTAEALRVLGGE